MASNGRRKIEIRRIERKEARQVCFSKRRPGLFKKAGELATLCGAEVAAVAFSPGGNAFSFGHPSVESVLGRFHPSNSPEAQAAAAVGGGIGDRNQAPPKLNQELGQVHALLDVEKAQSEAAEEALAKARAEGLQVAAWLETDVSQLGEEDLVAFVADLAKLDAADAVAARADQVPQETLLTRLTVHGGGGGFEFGGTRHQQWDGDDGDAAAAWVRRRNGEGASGVWAARLPPVRTGC
ncbi:hypothetical protein ACQ4PT_070381 [Festuca glaucescens]